MKQIKSALISVFYKDGLEEIVRCLEALEVKIYSTGGTFDFIKSLGVKAERVEDLTGYPSILGGRVKTLHPKVFGGILARRAVREDQIAMDKYEIPFIDLVIIDLYPFEKTAAMPNATSEDIVEKIDIGGISLIRAAAKNFNDVLIVPSVDYYGQLLDILKTNEGKIDLKIRRCFASYAFKVSSSYDMAIFGWFSNKALRYGENPHQKGYFYGDFDAMFEQLNGKEISYNNIGDIDAACILIDDFAETTFAIIKHNNACGLASRDNLCEAYIDALAGDPVSAFGGVLVCNKVIDRKTAEEMNSLFMEICIAPDYTDEALDVLKSKKNRIILKRKSVAIENNLQMRSALGGLMVQDKDNIVEKIEDLRSVTSRTLTDNEKADLVFANIIVKHTKSNAIVLAKNRQLCASGTGQTSRVDALRQAIAKAKSFDFDLHGAVMASDAFFPFPDCVEIAHKEGINCVIQPGGSIKDNLTTEYCEQNNMAMAVTGFRHFKH
jgi:phosphoribosylaminoimidazolecarboxamide formyltransferase/IMP cyclohydrolase